MNLNTTNRKNQEKNKSLSNKAFLSRPCKMSLRLWARSECSQVISIKEFSEFISTLSDTQLQILDLLMWYWVKGKVAYMEQEWIAKRVGCSREWVNKTVALFQQAGICDWYKRFKQSNIYRASKQILTRDYLQVLIPYFPSLNGFYLGLFTVASLVIPTSFLDAHDRNYRVSVHTNINRYILPTYGMVFESTAPHIDKSAALNFNARCIDIPETERRTKLSERELNKIFRSPGRLSAREQLEQLEYDVLQYRMQLANPDIYFAQHNERGFMPRSFFIGLTEKMLEATTSQIDMLKKEIFKNISCDSSSSPL